MGRYLEQTEARSELLLRIAAELKAKASARAKQEGDGAELRDAPDGVNDAAYLKGTKATTTLAPVWVLIFFAALAVLAFFIYQTNR